MLIQQEHISPYIIIYITLQILLQRNYQYRFEIFIKHPSYYNTKYYYYNALVQILLLSNLLVFCIFFRIIFLYLNQKCGRIKQSCQVVFALFIYFLINNILILISGFINTIFENQIYLKSKKYPKRFFLKNLNS